MRAHENLVRRLAERLGRHHFLRDVDGDGGLAVANVGLGKALAGTGEHRAQSLALFVNPCPLLPGEEWPACDVVRDLRCRPGRAPLARLDEALRLMDRIDG